MDVDDVDEFLLHLTTTGMLGGGGRKRVYKLGSLKWF